MQNKHLTVYLDESGYTGNNLLDKNQPIFVYGSVECTPAEASQLVSEVSKEFRLTGAELKGAKMCQSSKGQRAILAILSKLDKRFKFVVVNKKFAAACIVFEYLIEPTISECNWYFYEQKLNYYVADGIYSQAEID